MSNPEVYFKKHATQILSPNWGHHVNWGHNNDETSEETGQ